MMKSDLYRNGQHVLYGSGVSLEPGLGNNAFSLDRKPERSDLQVTPLRLGSLDELRVGEHIAFQDFDGDTSTGSVFYEWVECRGLESALLCLDHSVPIYVFDNHNHAFYGWCEGMKAGWFQPGATLVHVDAHFDDAEPKNSDVDISDLDNVWRYTNEVLQIATFIQPAVKKGVFSKVINLVESSDFEELTPVDGEVVLDIDLDVFCKEMDHISWQEKLKAIRFYLPQTKLITMATSPFFIDQQRAIEVAQRLVQELL